MAASDDDGRSQIVPSLSVVALVLVAVDYTVARLLIGSYCTTRNVEGQGDDKGSPP